MSGFEYQILLALNDQDTAKLISLTGISIEEANTYAKSYSKNKEIIFAAKKAGEKSFLYENKQLDLIHEISDKAISNNHAK